LNQGDVISRDAYSTRQGPSTPGGGGSRRGLLFPWEPSPAGGAPKGERGIHAAPVPVHGHRKAPALMLGGGFRSAAPQNGGSAGCWALPAPAGVDPQGSPPEGWPPNPLPPRLTLFTFAVAYRRLGPISSTASSMTVRFSPSLVS